MFDPGTILAGAAVTSAGVGIYNAMNTPSSPDTGTAPPPANYIAYNSDGTIASTQTWDASKNAYVYTPNPQPTPSNYGYSGSTDPNDSGYQSWLQTSQGQKYNSDNNTWNTSQQAAAQNKQQVTALENQMLSNLSQTPADRTQAYADYAKAYSNAMHTNVDYQYNKATQATADTMNARGMMGSKAYADTMGDLNWNKQQSDTQIADQATVASENLANVDKTYWSNLYGELENTQNASTALATQQAQSAAQIANQGTASTLAGYQLQNLPAMSAFQAQINKGTSLGQSYGNTSAGLAFLYGYGSKGGLGAKTSGGGSPDTTNNSELMSSYSLAYPDTSGGG